MYTRAVIRMYIGICTNCGKRNEDKVCPHCGKLYRSATYTVEELAELLYKVDMADVEGTMGVVMVYAEQGGSTHQHYEARVQRILDNNMAFPL